LTITALFLLNLLNTLQPHGSAAKAALIMQLNLDAAVMLGMGLLLTPLTPYFWPPNAQAQPTTCRSKAEAETSAGAPC